MQPAMVVEATTKKAANFSNLISSVSLGSKAKNNLYLFIIKVYPLLTPRGTSVYGWHS